MLFMFIYSLPFIRTIQLIRQITKHGKRLNMTAKMPGQWDWVDYGYEKDYTIHQQVEYRKYKHNSA